MDNNDNCTGIKGSKSVAYICSDELLSKCDSLKKVHGRASIVHSLIKSYGLLDKMRIESPKCASDPDLLLFHSNDYIQCVKRISEQEDDEKIDDEDEFGLLYDCPGFPGVHQYASLATGASVKAAECLMSGSADVAIHWTGGWHHAKRDAAAGFCYYNDVVIAILKLRERFNRVLYIDIDLHHGDGTGSLSDVGFGRGRYYTVNVPLKDGIQDKSYISLFVKILTIVHERFQPEAVVCQCGADGLVSDPMDSFNLTSDAYVQCIKFLVKWELPLLLLGGGGYNIANTAKCWTSITAAVLGESLSENIPEHKYFTLYGPDYDIDITPGNRPNENTAEYIEMVSSTVIGNLQNIEVK